MRNEAAFAALDLMRKLEDNWDSYEGKAINPHACNVAANILRGLPGHWTAVPCSDGAVQLENHEYGVDIEIRVSVNGSAANE